MSYLLKAVLHVKWTNPPKIQEALLQPQFSKEIEKEDLEVPIPDDQETTIIAVKERYSSEELGETPSMPLLPALDLVSNTWLVWVLF